MMPTHHEKKMAPSTIGMALQTAQEYAQKMGVPGITLTEFEVELYEACSRFLSSYFKLQRGRCTREYRKLRRMLKRAKRLGDDTRGLAS
jgi:hypothetical protein